MKYLKYFESNINYPIIGDYVYVDLSLHPNVMRNNILSMRKNKNKINTNIYKIIDIYGTDNEYKIDVSGIGIWIYRDEIIEYEKTINELILKMSTQKYNL